MSAASPVIPAAGGLDGAAAGFCRGLGVLAGPGVVMPSPVIAANRALRAQSESSRSSRLAWALIESSSNAVRRIVSVCVRVVVMYDSVTQANMLQHVVIRCCWHE